MNLKEFAAACGVSPGTASLALRGYAVVAPATARHVLAMAERLNYSPDPGAARLASRRFSPAQARAGLSVVLLTSHRKETFPHWWPIIKQRATELGYVPRKETVPEDPSVLPRLLRRWAGLGVAGIVLHGVDHPLPYSAPAWRHFSLIGCLGSVHISPCHRVTSHPGEAVLLAHRRLRALGYKAIGVAINRHPQPNDDDFWRLAAARVADRELGAKERAVPVYFEQFGTQEPELLRCWYAAHRPDAVIGFHAAMRATIEGGGWRCPDDFAFVTMHPGLEDATHSTAVCGTAIADCARVSVDQLDQMIRHRERGWPQVPRTILLPPVWTDGPTAPPRKVSRKS